MKIFQLLSGLGIALSNQEKEFVEMHKSKIKLSQLSEQEIWIAQNLVRKGIYSISNDDQTLIKKIDELGKINNVLTDRVKKLENQKTSATNLTIFPVDFGKQDDSFIDDETCQKILTNGINIIQEYTKIVHFNDKKPEFHNVYINNWKNKKDAYIMVDGYWQMEKLETVIKKLMNNGINFIKRKLSKLDKINDILSKSIICS